MTNLAILLFFIFSPFGSDLPFAEKGGATYYSDSFEGKRTINGERYDRTKLTAAHPTRPFNTFVRVTNARNGRSITVRKNDRMRASSRQIIDLSRETAVRIDLVQEGAGTVWVEEVEENAPPEPLLPLRKSELIINKIPLRK